MIKNHIKSLESHPFLNKTNFLYVMEKSSREGKSLIVFKAQWKES